MAQTPFSLLIIRRLSLSFHYPKPSPYLSHHLLATTTKSFSTSPSTSFSSSTPSSDSKAPSSLSDRLKFVFDQIDTIEKERSEKDQTLQRIRAWRESKKTQKPESELEISVEDKDVNSTIPSSAVSEPVIGTELKPVAELKSGVSYRSLGITSQVELEHPWPEWIDMMERLVQHNYFDRKRKDEEKMVQKLGFEVPENGDMGDNGVIDFKDYRTVQKACLNFGKDRFDIFRSLSRPDIQILVGFGCPTADKKVVFSSKLLRKHVHLDEGDVCSSCSLRGSCEKAYLLTNKEDEARTVDVMRVLFAYGFDPINVSIENKSLLKQKSVKTVVRKLLHEVVKLSSVPIDPNLPPPVIKKPPPKVKQPPPPKKRVGRDDIEMKRGDWLCPKCDFMNFAKNTVCLQCDAKRPKRQLLPGEWECPRCNFLNYRRNTECFHCECKRPSDEFMENKMQEKHSGPTMSFGKTVNRSEVSNAWNFDFDDDESDGADVDAFEHADSSVRGKDSALDNEARGGKFGRQPGIHDEYSDADSSRPHAGFDDFDDEEDDIDSYELDTGTKNSAHKASYDLSKFEGCSGSEDTEGSDSKWKGHDKSKSSSQSKQSKSRNRRAPFSESDIDSDEDLSVHPKWKSSHVADSRTRGRGNGRLGAPNKLSFGSDDDEVGLYSDLDDDLNKNFGSKGGKCNKSSYGKKHSHKGGISDFSGSDSEYDDRNSQNNKIRVNKADSNRRHDFKRKDSRVNSFNEEFDGPSQGFHGNDRGFAGSSNRGRMKDNKHGIGNSKGPKRETFGRQGGGKPNGCDRNKDSNFGDFRNSRRVIER